MMLVTTAPMLEIRLRGAPDIARAVRAVTGPKGLAGLARPPSPAGLDLIRRALAEVLGRVLRTSAGPRPGGAAVELWVEPGLAVAAVRFAGPPLPEWLAKNWDRGQPPAVPAPAGGPGLRWLTVREALDSVVQLRERRDNLLFLERRL